MKPKKYKDVLVAIGKVRVSPKGKYIKARIYDLGDWWYKTFENIDNRRYKGILAPASGTLFSKNCYSLEGVIRSGRMKDVKFVVNL